MCHVTSETFYYLRDEKNNEITHLLGQILLDPEYVVAELLVGHELAAPARELGHNAAHLVGEERILQVEHAHEQHVHVLLVLLGVHVEQVDARLVLLQHVVDERHRVLQCRLLGHFVYDGHQCLNHLKQQQQQQQGQQYVNIKYVCYGIAWINEYIYLDFLVGT